MLTITVLAVLAGARNFREAGDRAAELPADLLAAARARISPATGLVQPPSSATIAGSSPTSTPRMPTPGLGRGWPSASPPGGNTTASAVSAGLSTPTAARRTAARDRN